MTEAKLLTYDIENIGIRGWAWGMWEQNILHIDHPQHLLCLAYKWGHEKKVRTIAIWDFPLYKKDPHSDLELAKAFHKVISEADIVIGHNSDSFDNKMVNSMFMRHKLPPPPQYKQVDTKKVAKKYGRGYCKGCACIYKKRGSDSLCYRDSLNRLTGVMTAIRILSL